MRLLRAAAMVLLCGGVSAQNPLHQFVVPGSLPGGQKPNLEQPEMYMDIPHLGQPIQIKILQVPPSNEATLWLVWISPAIVSGGIDITSLFERGSVPCIFHLNTTLGTHFGTVTPNRPDGIQWQPTVLGSDPATVGINFFAQSIVMDVATGLGIGMSQAWSVQIRP